MKCHLPSNPPGQHRTRNSGTTGQRARNAEGLSSRRTGRGPRGAHLPQQHPIPQEGEGPPATAPAARRPEDPEADPEGRESREGVPEKVQGVNTRILRTGALGVLGTAPVDQDPRNSILRRWGSWGATCFKGSNIPLPSLRGR